MLGIQIKAVPDHEVFIAYIDLLGFRSKMREKNWADEVRRIFSIIDASVTEFSKPSGSVHSIIPKNKIQCLAGSDTIVLWIVPESKSKWPKVKALRYLLHAVEMLQFRCACNDIWMRGGVSFGHVVFDGSNVAGPGFLNALALEGSSIYPRVLVDAKMMRTLFDNCFSVSDYLKEINNAFSYEGYSGRFLYDFLGKSNDAVSFRYDYPFFVHYLNRLNDTEHHDSLDKIWINLGKNLFVETPRVFQKFQWVYEYLDHYSLEVLGGSNQIRLLFDTKPLGF